MFIYYNLLYYDTWGNIIKYYHVDAHSRSEVAGLFSFLL